MLNKKWGDIFSNYRNRNQLAFNYAAWTLNIPYSIIPSDTYKQNYYVIKYLHVYPSVSNWHFIKNLLKTKLLQKITLKVSIIL